MDRFGGQGVIEEGALQGRKFLIPATVFVEKGTFMNGQPEYARACLVHQRFIPDQGCDKCAAEVKGREQKARDLGLMPELAGAQNNSNEGIQS